MKIPDGSINTSLPDGSVASPHFAVQGVALSWRCCTCAASGAVLLDPLMTMRDLDLQLSWEHQKVSPQCPRLRLVCQWSPS